MQTFLPYPDIIKSIRCLDNKRLGKQRVEAYTILRTLSGLNSGWINHPAVKMWKGYETFLELYYGFCVLLWKDKGFKNNMIICDHSLNDFIKCKKPSWFGNKDFHDSHKSNLLRKFPEHYKQFN